METSGLLNATVPDNGLTPASGLMYLLKAEPVSADWPNTRIVRSPIEAKKEEHLYLFKIIFSISVPPPNLITRAPYFTTGPRGEIIAVQAS